MCPIKKETSAESGSPCSSPSASSTSLEHHQTVWTSLPKKRPRAHQVPGDAAPGVPRRPAPGQRRAVGLRGARAGRRGCRLWLGTFDTADAAACAHDAAMLAIAGGACCLNFADSAWLLAVPASASSYASLADVRRAVAEAVESFLRREGAAAVVDDARSAASSTSSSPASDDDEAEESSSATEDSPAFELDVFNDMSWDLYYASLAQAILMEPPPTVTTAFCDDGVAEVPLWSY
ncbi:unnamed protein product [Miscanthus lutarioriparius]|uniref:AP2/ERF domain-containing protein n=1 Tax=Miscanthus lutarioriparius TaxID=422564 RepID=A0A811NGH3_9POAL|nr:unnamed protein product [Miscanthus lutarioriparius]